MFSGQQTADGSEEESLLVDYVKKSQSNLFKITWVNDSQVLSVNIFSLLNIVLLKKYCPLTDFSIFGTKGEEKSTCPICHNGDLRRTQEERI